MSEKEPVNFTSLNLVHDELVASIEQAAAQLEQFATNREDGELLQACIDSMAQISGTFKVVQLPGAELLADELLSLAHEITLGQSAESDQQLNSLTDGFFILPRYVEYSLQTRRAMPELLLPHLNALRQARKAAALAESYFYQMDTADCDIASASASEGTASTLSAEELTALLRRLRHMYQIGLLAVMQGQQIKPSLAMMQRALVRLDAVSGGQPLSRLWWVAAATITAMMQQNMLMSKSRKLLLARIDRYIKQFQQGGEALLAEPASPELLKELLYLLALSDDQSALTETVRKAYALVSPGYSDAELQCEREALQGPNANTLSSMASVLKDELHSTKDMLERAAQGGADMVADYDELLEVLNKVADILSLVGLTSPSQSLKQEINRIEGWRDRDSLGDAKELLEVADVLLYVESSISGLERMHLSDEKLAKVNSVSRREVIASSQLAEAESLVLSEAEAGLALLKRALTAFTESNFDRSHINNVSTTLTSVRGGMVVLGLQRAATVVGLCAKFVDQALMQSDQPAALQQMLETFADAVISLEYYLDAVKYDKDTDDQVLAIAEESLAALGFE